MRSRRLLTVLTSVLLLLGVTACDGATVNRWLGAHGKPQLREPELSKVVALLNNVEAEINRRNSFVGKVDTVTAERLGLSWRPGCPVAPADLRLLTLSYWGMDGTGHTGEMIVNRSIALPTVAVFRQLWNEKFPVNRMDTAEKFAKPTDFNPDGTLIETHDPDLVNDTSAFFCRQPTGSSGWSQHAYGLAIDINPVQNAYVKGSTIVPVNATVARNAAVPGTITAKSLPVTAFKKYGMVWGGTWSSLKDYMHFSRNGR